ncbi:MAG: NAD-dependent epimerase/dehydratase family protein [Candidatus Aminicenantes bacterium]|nr:NAD-dependent epimerase/dehydratase family protein [Candidatus Aminicenantes bacterium]
MKVLLTGGTGFIGSHLAEALTASGHEVYALVRDPGTLKFLKGIPIRLVPGGLLDAPAFPPGLDRVFHLAGLTKALKTEAYFSVNRFGTASLLETLAAQGQFPRLIHLSSMAAAGPSIGGRPRREDDPPAPVSPYGRSKLAGEAEVLARADRFPSVIIRVGAVYGPRDEEFARFFRILKRGILPCFGPGRQPISICYVKDLVRALILAGEAGVRSGEIFQVGNPDASSFEEIGRLAALHLGRRARRLRIPMAAVKAAARLSDARSRRTGRASLINRPKVAELEQTGWEADVGKARAELGFETTYSLDAGLAETLDWCLAQGRI